MITIHKLTQSALIVILLCTLVAPSALAQLPSHAAIFHALQEQAVTHPNDLVQVIIQVEPADFDRLTAAVTRLGGQITASYRFIHAAAASLPAGAVLALPGLVSVRAISPNAPVVETGCKGCKGIKEPDNIYPLAVGADRLWVDSPALQGAGVKAAIVDSGYFEHEDLRLSNKKKSPLRVTGYNFTDSPTALDNFGHGTNMAGIIAGNGADSKGKFTGIAPLSNLVSLKVCGDDGACLTSDILEGLQWIYDHGKAQGIRVVNLSINSLVEESYLTNPLCAGLEVLWFNGFVVVVSAGNQHNGELLPPANDPFVITVGSTDDKGTADIRDDVVSSFSSYGATLQGIPKPNLVAPGRDVISLLSSTNSKLAKDHPDHIVKGSGWMAGKYLRISGTSVSAAIVTGAVVLLLEDEPGLNPDQVKYRLMATAVKNDGWPGYDPHTAGAGYLDIYAAVHGATTETANTGVVISQRLWSKADWAAYNKAVSHGQVNWGTVNWGTVNWGSVNWGTVNWGTVNWGTVNWGTVNWGTVNWGSDYWGPYTS